MLQGRLLEYWPSKRLVAFESGKCGARGVIILLGGLTDGLVPTPYTKELDAAAKESGYALVQPVLRTSYCQFGTGTLQHDLEDLKHLVSFLAEDPDRSRDGPVEVAMVGHSTGCQMICTFTRDAPEELKEIVKAVALQAPVSDREGLTMEMDPQRLRNIIEAAQRAVAENEPKRVVHTLWGRAPMMARRCLDLFLKNGADDFFSSDFTNDELAAKLGHLAAFKTLFAISLDDEYVPDDTYPGHGERLQAAVPGSELLMLEDADHGLSRPVGAGAEFVEAFMAVLGPAPAAGGGGSSGGSGGGGGDNDNAVRDSAIPEDFDGQQTLAQDQLGNAGKTLASWASSLARSLGTSSTASGSVEHMAKDQQPAPAEP